MGYFDHLKQPQGERPLRAVPAPRPSDGSTTPYAAAALRGEVEQVATAPEGTRNDTLNKAWLRMGRHVGAGSISVTEVRNALADAARATGLPEHEIELVLRDDETSGLRIGMADPRHPDADSAPGVTVLDLEPDTEALFWDARPLLTHIHTFARARMVAPWAVLGVTLARILTATPHQVVLPPTIGGKQSLNLFVGLVGPSGSGKGAAEAVAAEAVEVGYITSHNVGSGEGIAHGYMHRTKGGLEWNDDDHAVLFSVPEIDSLAAQGDRKGATLFPQLRSGWTGESLGFGYADPTKRIIIPAHQYRLCLVAGIQPARAACLLDDTDGGTPQRFLWMSATDPDAPDREPPAPQPITWAAPPLGSLSSVGGTRIDVCDLAVETIKEARRARNRGDGDALDGHALLAQLKTAAALGVADGRYSVTDEDWRLAGIIARKSAHVRGKVADALSRKARAINEARAEAEAHRAVHVEERVTDAAIKRACGTLLRKLRRSGDWTPGSDLRRALAAKDRAHFETALDRLLDTGQIESDEARRDLAGHGGRGTRYKLKEEA